MLNRFPVPFSYEMLSLYLSPSPGCPETVTTFLGSPGELIEGKVEPSLANVTVVVDLGSEGQVTTYTDVSGYYRLD